MAQHVSVRGATYECLINTINPDTSIRRMAEEKLKALQVTEDFPLVLTEMTIDDKESPQMRQLAAVILRQHVEVHWSDQSEKFSSPEVSHNAKEMMRSLLPKGLSDPMSQVRSNIAAVISSIAQWDWPEAWPDLFAVLLQALSSGNVDLVSGSMKVLSDLSEEISSESQMSQIAPLLFPELYKVFVSTQQFNVKCRCKSISIFKSCVNTIIQLGHDEKGCIKRLLAPALPKFLDAFLEALKSDNEEIIDASIKTEILRLLVLILREASSLLNKDFMNIVTCVWQNLVKMADVYVKQLHLSEEELEEETVDSDGERLGTSQFVYTIFEFIHCLLEKPKYQKILEQNIQELLYYVVLYTQMNQDEELRWTQSAAEFVEDEDDDTFSFSVRISANELYQVLVADFEEIAMPAIVNNIKTHLEQSEQLKTSGNPNWWRVHEALFYSLGRIRMMFIESVKKGKVNFDLNLFIQNVLLPDLNESNQQFLIGRVLWFTARISHALPPETLVKFLGITSSALSETQTPVIRISAVRAIYAFSDNLIMIKQPELLRSHLENIYTGILSIAQGYGTEVLALSLDALEIVLKIDQSFTSSVADKAMPFLMAVFLKYSDDPHLVMVCKDVMKQLSLCNTEVVQQRILPTLLSILQQGQSDKLPTSLQPVALEMVEAVVRGSKDGELGQQLMSLFPVITSLTMNSDDSAIMQNGGECLRAYVSKSAQQVATWTEDNGTTGLTLIGNVVSKLLDPRSPEMSAAYIGRLVSLLVSKLGDSIGNDIDLILRAVLSKLQLIDTLAVIQELVMVFARLILANVELMLDFLTMTPGPDGTAALNFVLNQWLSKQHLFFGAYEHKVGAMALAKLLMHAINTNDARLQSVTIQEEVIPDSGIPRTRSKAKNNGVQYVQIPALIKMYKLLISELNHQLEEIPLILGGDDSSSDEEGEPRFLDDFGLTDFDHEDDVEDDPDVLNDPIYHTNLKDYLTQFLTELSRTEYFSSFSQHNTSQEQQILQHIGINTAN